MWKKLRLFIVYFPVLLIAGQVLVNLLYFVAFDWYIAAGFYLNTFFGTNVFFAFFLVVFTYNFKFCAVSRYAALGQLAFAVNYMIVKEDNLYNIMFQVIIGSLAILLTFRHYIKKFPLCRLSLLLTFIGSVAQKGSCRKGLEKWEGDIKKIVLNNHYASTRNRD